MTAYVSVFFALAGALVYGFAEGKASELGRLTYPVALLVFLLSVSGHAVKLF